MTNNNENGRSMVEMLGVLAIIGVLTVGGLGVINQTRQEQKSAQMASDLANLARSAKKLACQYDEGYQYNYTLFLYKSNAYPEGWTYSNSAFTDKEGTSYSLSQYSKDEDNEYFVSDFSIYVKELSDDACIRLATSDWGTESSTGFIQLQINSSATATAAMSYDTAASACNKDSSNKIMMSYRGCR